MKNWLDIILMIGMGTIGSVISYMNENQRFRGWWSFIAQLLGGGFGGYICGIICTYYFGLPSVIACAISGVFGIVGMQFMTNLLQKFLTKKAGVGDNNI